ncbi:MAG: hypothetical protein V2A66_02995 [Pseudomonadota bacterium]
MGGGEGCKVGMQLMNGGTVNLRGHAEKVGNFCSDTEGVKPAAYSKFEKKHADEESVYVRADMAKLSKTRAVAVAMTEAKQYCAKLGKRLPTPAEVQLMIESDQLPFVSVSHFAGRRAFTWTTSAADTRVGYEFSKGNRIFGQASSSAGDMSSDSAFFCVADPEKS